MRWMQTVKLVIFFSPLFGPSWSAFAADSAVVLQYHHVSADTPASTSVSPEQFERHLEYLAENGFNVRPLERAIMALQT